MPAAFESIQTASPSGGTSIVTFSNLQTTTQYDHFMLSCYFQASSGAGGSNVLIRFNETNTNYNYIRTMADGGSGSVSANADATEIDIADVGSGFGAAIVWIIGARTGEYKNVYSQGAPDSAQRSKFDFGQWRNTNNITSISFFLGDGRGMSSNTRIALYGIKGA